MQGLDFWRICDSVSVIQAALLIVDSDPAVHQYSVESQLGAKQPVGYEAVVTAMKNAVSYKSLPAKIAYTIDDFVGQEIDWHRTLVDVEDLRNWLIIRGVSTGFFFPDGPLGPEYLNPQHPKYASKLAAAIEAWNAISQDEESTRGKSVKKALLAWLRRHADRYGLTKDDGSPNEQGIEEVAKVANWDISGGAPKTPSSNPPTH